jgi:hypothetical protein
MSRRDKREAPPKGGAFLFDWPGFSLWFRPIRAVAARLLSRFVLIAKHWNLRRIHVKFSGTETEGAALVTEI